MLSNVITRKIQSPKYQVCLITKTDKPHGTELRHLYTSPRSGITYFSAHRANNYTHEEARKALEESMSRFKDAFIQSEYDCHYRETDEYGTIKDYM